MFDRLPIARGRSRSPSLRGPHPVVQFRNSPDYSLLYGTTHAESKGPPASTNQRQSPTIIGDQPERKAMSSASDTKNMALFCDFENVALGVREAKYPDFDIRKVLERLLLKGDIVVKKAYCDWERYKDFKKPMHEAAFELIEIPHVRMSGKNSADIRMVVDALDLCYTKAHVDTFVIISGDSDFSPLVSKLRENNKVVIGVGVKKSSSDLLINNCDEFIFYDDLAREKAKKQQSRKKPAASAVTAKAASGADRDAGDKDGDGKKAEALDLVMETIEALFTERGAEEKIWGSMVKQALKRRQPGFNESYYGFRSFGKLLDEAHARKLLVLEPDEKSGGVIIKSYNPDY
jgi:uncharacterized protein (TIGR00288 family)